MTNPRNYPDVIESAETGRPLRRGVKTLTIDIDGQPFTYGQPGWWASLDDPADKEGQLIDEDNVVWAAAHREARAKAKHATLTPLVIRAIREACGLSQREAARVFGGGSKAFEKYEAGEVAPSSAMTRLLLLAARRPELFQKGSGTPTVSEADATMLREVVRKSSVEPIYERVYNRSEESEIRPRRRSARRSRERTGKTPQKVLPLLIHRGAADQVMAKRRSSKDFRYSRAFLPDDVFALVEGKRSGPTGLVSEDVWNEIMHLPDDVALTTSNHHGLQLAALQTLWGDWIEAHGDDHEEALFEVMLDATDCFQSSTFDALHGYYRSALSNLRSALELAAIGTLGNLEPTNEAYLRWKDKGATLAFPDCRKRLRRLTAEPVSSLLFKQGGWMEDLYYQLCAYAHSRPDASDGAIWESNGPVYSGAAFMRAFGSQTATYAACFHLVKVGRPAFVLSKNSEFIFLPPLASRLGEQMYRTVFGA